MERRGEGRRGEERRGEESAAGVKKDLESEFSMSELDREQRAMKGYATRLLSITQGVQQCDICVCVCVCVCVSVCVYISNVPSTTRKGADVRSCRAMRDITVDTARSPPLCLEPDRSTIPLSDRNFTRICISKGREWKGKE